MDEKNLSEGELELNKAVISVNQYIMQSRYGGNAGGGHYDRQLSASSSINAGITNRINLSLILE